MGEANEGWDVPGIVRAIDTHEAKHHIAATTEGLTLAALLEQNPDEGIRQIRKAYDNGLDYAYTGEDGQNNRSFIQAVAGGPHEAVPAAVYNAVGAVYPRLTREQKDAALKEVLGILDGIRYDYVQNSHTPFIHEPLLLGDIAVVRRMYWPGIDEGKSKIAQYPSFFEFNKELMDEQGLFRQDRVNSAYVLAFTLLRSDFSSWGEGYAKAANPEFLERTLRGMAAWEFGHPPALRDWTDEEAIARLRKLLPLTLHDRIEPLRKEGGWADWEEFQREVDLRHISGKQGIKFKRLERIDAERS